MRIDEELKGRLPDHVGIIMDGNGRWAKKRGLPRSAGHKQGAEVFRTICKYASEIGIKSVTFYAFSTENWKRPEKEVNEMCYGIAIHVDDKADFDGERTPLALTVADADNIDRFDAYRLYEGLQDRVYRDIPLKEQKAFVDKALSRLPKLRELPCGTKTGEALWKEKVDYQIGFYQRLLHQIETSERFVSPIH